MPNPTVWAASEPTRIRYDYLLHASVPEDELWGLPRSATGLDCELEFSADAMQEALTEYLQSGETDRAALDRYKRLNHALAVFEGEQMVVDCASRPFVVQISRTERCNLSCSYCRPTPAHQSTKVLDRDVWEQALPILLRPALEFLPYCWGEPLMAPDFDLTCEYADRYGVAMSFITNMSFLDRRLASLFVRHVDRALISIDTPDAAMLQRIRRGGKLSRIERNLDLLRDTAAAADRPMPWLGVSAVMMRSTLGTLPDLVHWAAARGLRGLSARRVMIREAIQGRQDDEAIDLDGPEYRSVLAEVKAIARDTGLLLSIPDPDFCLGQEQMCPCPWHHVYMSASATLSMCCFSHRDVVAQAPIENDFWNSPRLTSNRRAWGRSFRCSECSSLDFVGRPEVSQVRGY